jgi:signal peptidase I
MANYFSIFLVILTLGSGLVWLADSLLFAPKRKDKVLQANAGIDEAAIKDAVPLPYIVDTAQQIFPVIAFVLVLRSFLYEPFQIPSGSMMPTLLVGDFILVEKFTYGLKDPVMRHKFWQVGTPERGDVVVFKYPLDTRIDYIKRVIGLPGDTIVYRNKQVFIKPACNDPDNCQPMQPVDLQFEKRGEFYHDFVAQERYTEQLADVSHGILRTPGRLDRTESFYQQPGTQQDEWLVPEGYYFCMGDNRDNSLDGRFWGFVPDENLVGRAVAIWISFEFDRVPSSWIPAWVPSGVRFERVGSIQ